MQKNEQVFPHSCFCGNLEVAKWLCTLCDNYYLEHNDNKIISYKILTDQEVEEKRLEKKNS